MDKKNTHKPEMGVTIWNRDEYFDPLKDWKKIETDYFEKPFIIPTKEAFRKRRELAKNLRRARYIEEVLPRVQDPDLQDRLDFLVVVYAWVFCGFLIYAVLTHRL